MAEREERGRDSLDEVGARATLQLREGRGERGLVGGFEEGRAGDECIRAGLTADGAGGEIDATVDFEAEREVALAAPGVDLLELGHHVGAERLAAETGLDGHDEDKVDLVEERFDGGGGRIGIEDDAALAAEVADVSEGGGVIVSGLDMDTDEVGAGFGEGVDVAVRLVEHEVGVEEGLDAVAAEGGDGFGTEGEIRDEMAVHDVDVEPGESEVIDEAGAGGEMCVIAGEDRRDEERGVHRGGITRRRGRRARSCARAIRREAGRFGIRTGVVRHRSWRRVAC